MNLSKYAVMEAPHFPGQWNVSAIDWDQDGKLHNAVFNGPEAHRSAVEYAEWKNSQQPAEHHMKNETEIRARLDHARAERERFSSLSLTLDAARPIYTQHSTDWLPRFTNWSAQVNLVTADEVILTREILILQWILGEC